MDARLRSASRARPAAALAAVLLAAACAGPPRPLIPPSLEVGAWHFAGTVVSGRQPDPTAAERVDDSALVVSCELRYLASMPDGLEPVGDHTRLVVAGRGDHPLLPAAPLATGARMAAGAVAETQAGRAPGPDEVLVRRMRGALVTNSTAVFEIRTYKLLVADTGEPVQRRSAVMVSRGADGALSAALVLDDLAPDTAIVSDDPHPAVGSGVIKRQAVLLSVAPDVGGGTLALAMRSPFSGERDGPVFLALIRVDHVSARDAGDRQALADCRRDLRQESEEAAAASARVGPQAATEESVAASLVALADARYRRAALVFLAGEGTAPMALDLALTADEATLSAWVKAVEAAARTDAGGRGDTSWLLQRTAMQLLAERLDAGELSQAQSGLLVLHTGEAGRFPGSLAALLARSHNGEELSAALRRENLEFLAMSDPGARVRAFDWLRDRGLAPDGYDPLAPVRERRRALARAQSAAEANAATSEEPDHR